MFHHLPTFKVDYSLLNHLILPFSSFDKSFYSFIDDDGSIYIIAYKYCFVLSDNYTPNIDAFLKEHRDKIKKIIFPKKDRTDKYLLFRDSSIKASQNSIDEETLKEILEFYNSKTCFTTSIEYLMDRYNNGSSFYYIKSDEKIVTCAYTIKDNKLLVNLATAHEYLNKGYASCLINTLPLVYLFVEDNSLLDFYLSRGFRVVKEYQVMEF